VTNPQVAQLAKNAGYDSIFIDLEHSTLSIDDAGNISSAALSKGITPFVRVPYQCGNGFVQKVMDAGAMGVVFPHVSSQSMVMRNSCFSRANTRQAKRKRLSTSQSILRWGRDP
jgi:2-keto-3-deoxy-L-rhamnonate aldolase RhmA